MSEETKTVFVVLRHELPGDPHYDLMIRSGDALATWQCAEAPWTARTRPVACRRIQDHRLAYLEYEGEVSGGRGVVTRVESGTCRVLQWDENRMEAHFHGSAMRERFILARQADQSSWLLEELGA